MRRIADTPTILFTNSAVNTVANTATETAVASAITKIGSHVMGAYLLKAGSVIRIRTKGILSCLSSATINYKIKIGTTVIVATGVITIPAALTNKAFDIQVDLTTLTVGGTGTVIGSGTMRILNGLSTVYTAEMMITAAVTVSTIVSNNLETTVTWGAASASNTITTQTFTLELLN
jgi:hypothetical protein